MIKSQLQGSPPTSRQSQPSSAPTVKAPISSRQIIISSQGVDRAHEGALMSEISEQFKPDHLDRFGSLIYLTYDKESLATLEPKDLDASWSGDLVSISKNSLQLTDAGTLTTPEGGTVSFLKDTVGPITPAEIKESTLEYEPSRTDGNDGAVGGRVRVRSVCGRGVSPWLKVGDAPMNPIEDTDILIWSLPVMGLEQSVDEASKDHEGRLEVEAW